MSKELIARVAGDAISAGPVGPKADGFREASTTAELAVRLLEMEDVVRGREMLIEAVECYLKAHGCRSTRDAIAQEIDSEIQRRIDGSALMRRSGPR